MEENSHTHRPWELITAALQGDLAPDDEPRFRDWLADSATNQQEFERLQQLWKDGVADYPRYLEADETRAWSDLQARLDPGPAPRIGWRRWAVAVAAVLIITTGLGVLGYYLRPAHPSPYQTAANEQRTITLPDGTTMSLEGLTSVRVEAGYNRSNRTIMLLSGQAHFDVMHQAGQPFMVDAGTAVIRDIGTSFTVNVSKDSVGIIVTSGKVSVEDKETRQLTSLAAGEKTTIQTLNLNFHNAPLSVVVDALQKEFGKPILLEETTLAKKEININLEGESFEEAIKVICASLDLDRRPYNNGYVLSKATR